MNITRLHTWAVTWLVPAVVLGLGGPAFGNRNRR